jgi:hypothetical protein
MATASEAKRGSVFAKFANRGSGTGFAPASWVRHVGLALATLALAALVLASLLVLVDWAASFGPNFTSPLTSGGN